MTTMETLYRALGEELGTLGIVTTSAVAVGPDPTRWVIASPTTGDTLRVDGDPSMRWEGAWLYVANGAQAGAQRRCVFARPELGALAMDAPFATALAASVETVVTTPFPVTRQHDVPGLLQLVVQGLRDFWVEDLVAVTTVAGATSYGLSAQAGWLDGRDRVIELIEPPLVADYAGRPRTAPWELRVVAGVPTLVLLTRPWRTSGYTAYLRVRRPAYTLVGGAESTTGPTATTDTVLAQVADAVPVGLLHAYRWLSGWGELSAAERDRYGKLIPMQEALVRDRLGERYRPRMRPATEVP